MLVRIMFMFELKVCDLNAFHTEYALIIGEQGGKDLLTHIMRVYAANPTIVSSANSALETVTSMEAMVKVSWTFNDGLEQGLMMLLLLS